MFGRERIEELEGDNHRLKGEIELLYKELAELKDTSGQAVIDRLTKLAKDCKIDVHGETYQGIMTRVFLDIGGRESNVLKGYSATTFLKDNPEDMMLRMEKHLKDKNLLTASSKEKK